jgi:hypothetical protein
MSNIEQVDEFPDPPRRGAPEKYPYDDWFDGSIWKIDSIAEFGREPGALGGRVHAAAERRGLVVQTATMEDELYVQVIGKVADES